MAPFYLILALVIQCSFLHAEKDVPEDKEELDTLQKQDADDEEIKDLPSALKETSWVDMFGLPNNNNMYATPSASMMAQVTNSNKTLEEQLKDIQKISQEISQAIEAEMVSLFSYAMANTEKEIDEKGVRRRRSVETPMDSTEMVMRLLKHIRSNNEYQNVAIDKMMSAQEIAEKFGIEFNPDPEILSELAVAANEHAQEMTNMLKDACTLKNVTTEEVEFVPVIDEPKKENDTYYIYGVHPEERISQKNYGHSYEYMPEIISKPQPPVCHRHFSEPFPSYNYPHESQIKSPPVHHHSAPVTPMPSSYDPFLYPSSASDYFNPYCSVESVPAILVPIEDSEPEPELVGEEVEETITSRMIVEKGDKPGATSVNHVTTYTISEKSHFKPPQIEQLPQHFQYCFFLV